MTALQSTQNAAAFQSLYDFKISPDGAFPLAPLLQVGSELYGTTSQGGKANASGDGTVFKISSSGKEHVMYSFKGTPDGQFPQAGLIHVNGLFYGTTPSGGASGNGTVFTITKSGKEKVLYSFQGGVDGSAPTAKLLNVHGTLYGTTILGGGTSCTSGGGCGTVFKIDSTGETVVYRFQGGNDGQLPAAALIDVNGTLYGTTFFGGGTGCNFKGCGTVFALDASGAEHVVHSFKGGSDGANPSAELLNVKGNLYGTTSRGGSNDNGTVFKVSTSGHEKVLYKFKGGGDGADPEAGLVNVAGILYGTTFAGGTETLGTIYQVTRSGSELVLHSFTGPSDGANPSATMIDVKGTLYGTTKTGGGAGNGTVFSLSL